MDSASPIAQSLAAQSSDSSWSTPGFAMDLRFELSAEFPNPGHAFTPVGTSRTVPDRGRYRSDYRPLAPGDGRPA